MTVKACDIIGWLWRGRTGAKRIAFTAAGLISTGDVLTCCLGSWPAKEFYAQYDWLERGYPRLKPGDVECVKLER